MMKLSHVLVFLAGLAAASTSLAYDSVVVINEIQYNPGGDGLAEWIELRNLHAVDVNLGRWKLTSGIDYVFPEGTTIPGHGYLVIAAKPETIPGALGPFSGRLSNSGETIRLRNQSGRIMDEVEYGVGGDWPVGPDGSGATLARIKAGAHSGPQYWSASAEIGGTPGRANFKEPGSQAESILLITLGEEWKYWDAGTPPPEGWTQAGFDDAAWKTGKSLLAGGGAKLGSNGGGGSTEGLIASWSFEETSGTVAANDVPGGLPGTLVNGASFVEDPVRGRVVQFDGIDDRMEVIDPQTNQPSLNLLPLMTLSNDFTWAAWVWTDTMTNGGPGGVQTTAVILGNRSGIDGADTIPREFIKLTPASFQFHRNSSTESLDYTDLVPGQWTHMAVVKRGAVLEYYRNGVEAGNRSITQGQVNRLPFFVGGDRRVSSPTNEHFQGRVDDVKLWNRALSAVELNGLASSYGTTPVLPTPPEQTTSVTVGAEPRYFRKIFTYNGSTGAVLKLWPVADDGVVIYLNGVEVWRHNVPVESEVGDAAFPSEPITITGPLANGVNVLAAEVYQAPGGNPDVLFGATLEATLEPQLPPVQTRSLVFNEIAPAGDPEFFIELRNVSAAPVSTAGWTLAGESGSLLQLPERTVAPGEFLTLDRETLGFTATDRMRLFLLAPGGGLLKDAREVTPSLRGLREDGRWDHPTSRTPGAPNAFVISDAIVINEIFYNGINDSPEQWVELHNKSEEAVDVGGWRLSEGVSYTFPAGTTIPAGGFVVVAWDPAAFATLHPGVTALGPWSGNLSRKGETLRLRDAADNVVDEVTYYDGGRWPSYADGGGSSLELIDPRADNSQPSVWAASDESLKTPWETYVYEGLPTASGSQLSGWHEFIFGLLDAGECLIDDISVKENPGETNERELIQNGTFSSGTADKWQLLGTHRHSTVVDDPFAPGNKVLKVKATAATEHMHNHITTALKAGNTFVNINTSRRYRISFRAKWIAGSPRLHTRLYFNRLARQTILPVPPTGGTPGAPNSRRVANAGPTFTDLIHFPAVPAAGEPAVVSVRASDPDGVVSVRLFTSINGAPFTSTPMTLGPDGVYTGTVPGQAAGTLVQFCVEATDGAGASAFWPAEGPNSRAIIPWDDGRAKPVLPSGKRPHQCRVVLTPGDARELYMLENVMSNEYRPCTVIWDEREIYYGAGVRLKSSEHGRFASNRVGYNLKFGRDEPFMGAHLTVSVDRSGNRGTGGIDGNDVNSQREILIKAVSNAAGGILATEDDIIRIIPPLTTSGPGIAFNGQNVTGAALLSKSRFDDEYLDGVWEDGGSSSVFKYELLYPLSQTINPETRQIDPTPQREHPKIPQAAGGVVGVSVTSLGNDKENYRWNWLIRNGRSRDDYSRLMAAVTAVGRTGTAFHTETAAHLDVSAWLRACIPAILFKAIDNYLADQSQHNALLAFPPGRKGVIIPWDLDYLNQDSPTASLTSGGDLSKFLGNGSPGQVNRRLYFGHMLDILKKSFNAEFLTKWAEHYSQFDTDDMTTSLNFLIQRANYANQAIRSAGGVPEVEFSITTAGPLMVDGPVAKLTGRGWINVDTVRLEGAEFPLPVTWTNSNTWTLDLPVNFGTHTYVLKAQDRDGVEVGSASITVTSTYQVAPAGPGSIIISELGYNPPSDDDLEEFVELLNVSGAPVDLGGCFFGDGIEYTFPPGVVLPAGGRILVVRDQAAFAAMYPNAGPVASGVFSGALNNAGETIALYAANGTLIFSITYTDDIAITDGGGHTLVRVIGSGNTMPADEVWRASVAPGGSPGGTDALAFTGEDPWADQDGDGLCALLEYAAGTSGTEFTPMDEVLALRPIPGGTFVPEVYVLPNADDAIVVLEASSDLREWRPVSNWNAALPPGQQYLRLRVNKR